MSYFYVADDCPKYDVGFILDESSSLQTKHFREEKRFAIDVAGFFNIAPNGGRASVISFANESHLHIKFSDYQRYNDFSEAVDKLERARGMTDIIGALDKGLREMFQPINGMRTEEKVKKLAFLITDGISSLGKKERIHFTEMKEKYQRKDITLFVIGIGNVDEEKLKLLVEDSTKYYVHINNFEDLFHVLLKYVEQSECKGKYYKTHSFLQKNNY